MRGPGPDYFRRYTAFSKVDVYSSDDFDEHYQAYVYEDRTRYPNRAVPYRTPSPGARHLDLVPVCYVD